MSLKGAIFDMDGVLVDNKQWHIKAWIEFARMQGRSMSPEEIESHFGNTNRDYLSFLFGHDLASAEVKRLGDLKEDLYRKEYEPYIQPLKGLVGLLKFLKKKDFRIAVATSGPRSNLDFVLDHLDIREYFDVLVYESMIRKGKPDPEIFLKAANLLGLLPGDCVVFEDSPFGVNAAISAGMKVIGINTLHNPQLISHADKVVNDFSELSPEDFSERTRINCRTK